MRIAQLINRLKDDDTYIRLTAEDRLQVVFPDGHVPDETLLGILKERREEVILYLKHADKKIPVKPLEEQTDYPCSPSQKRLWVLQQLIGASAAYHVSVAYRFSGVIDLSRFETALRRLTEKHEVMRTCLIVKDNEPRQRILPEAVHYFSFKDVAVTEEALIAEIQAFKEQPFQLSEGQLFRVGMWKREGGDYYFMLVMHHVISDGWSVEVLMEELIRYYNGDMAVTEMPAVQYKEYAVWLNALSEAGRMEQHRQYWLDTLHGELPVLNIPTDLPRPVIQTYNGQHIQYEFPVAVVSAFSDMVKGKQASVFMGIMALINTLFHRYTGQQDIIVGTPIAGRPDNAFERQLGFYVNTVVLRTRVSGEDSFFSLLEQTRDNVLAAYEHQLYPFDKLVEEVSVHRDVSRSPVFDVMINYQEGSYLSDRTPVNTDLEVAALVIEDRTSQFDLSFDFTLSGNVLKVLVEYNTDLFMADRIHRMIGHLQGLMDSVTLQPSVHINVLNYIGAEERRLLLHILNEQQETINCNHTMHGLFEEQAARHPQRPAVIHGASVLDFATLNEQANQVAHQLVQQGIQKGQFVGVFLERGAQLAIAMMAIYKAGGVYVPVDHGNPSSRIQLLLKDATPFAVITNSALLQRELPCFEQIQLEVLILMDEWTTVLPYPIFDKSAWRQMSTSNVDGPSTPEDWAYMIYTSGTTGKPKGAILRHNGALNHMMNEFHALSLPDGFRFLQSANISSDISVWQFVAPWMLGGACVIVDKEDLQVYDRLLQILDQQAVTMTEFVPSYFSQLLSFMERYPDSRPPLQHMQWMMLSGEEVTVDAVNGWKRLYPHVNVLNAYGPTEASDDITHLLIYEPLRTGITKVPIGRPFINLNIFLVDKQLQLVPFGYHGEICVSGVGVGVGYWNLPEKTKEVFVPNPFEGTAGDRIYRTGDLGRWLPDGNLEFGGRIDQQVKIRGFRVEVAEIESVCREHDFVKDAVVLLQPGKEGEKKLVAYLLPADQEMSERQLIEIIRQYLAEKLPDHMVPPVYVVMEQFPTGLSDKVDRKALPGLDEITATEVLALPEGHLEMQLQKIWKQVLNKEAIGVHSNFFESGGHSLKAIQMTSRIYHDLGVRLALKDIFINPTIRQQAALIEASVVEKLPALQPAPEATYYPLSNAQQRIWISERLYENSMAYNMPMKYVFNGQLDTAALEKALFTIIDRHEILRTRFFELDGIPYQQVIPMAEVAPYFSVHAIGEAITVNDIVWQPFDLEKGVLLRVDILPVTATQYLLLMVSHHIISDGWSEDIFLNELVLLYDHFRKGEAPSLSPLSLQYKDYAVWQQSFLRSTIAAEQLQYWLRQFAGPVPMLELPIDFPRAEKKTFEAIDFKLELDLVTAEKIKMLATATGSSTYMILLSAIYVFLYRYTGQTDLVIGSPVAARNHLQLEDQIGCYMNTLALRVQLDANISFRELLEQVKQNTLNAFDHQDYPFDLLLSKLQYERYENRLPLFDVGFTWLNTIGHGDVEQVYEQGDYTVLPYTDGAGTVKSDCWIHAWEDTAGAIGVVLSFNKGLFRPQTASSMTDDLGQLIHHFVHQPDSEIHLITDMLVAAHKKLTTMNRNETKKKNLEKFFNIQTQPAAEKSIIRESVIPGNGGGLKLVTAAMPGVNLPRWLDSNRATVDKWLAEYGGILFRGFNVDTNERVQETADSFSGQQLRYFDQTSPRSALTGALYTSTDHPSDQVIHMHNELSYSFQWPLHIMFCCLIPSEEGGETPVADVRQVWKLLSEETRRKFRANGVKYVRNMRPGVGLSWQQVFQTNEKEKAAQHFIANKIAYEWKSDDHLHTEWTLPAVQQHPLTQEEVWFNHCFFYNEHMIESSMYEVLSAAGELPFNTYYGNGEPVEAATIQEIVSAFEAAKISFPWEKGDALLLDNMLMAHGRNPYKGNRKIAVAMFNPQSTPIA
ncbi:non-ribosomal peptide synthetase [Chitinophaga filiformis]|uniref:Amino acid adenylation domain-containing protein n=1 Tax=Chitinophaga filiformis TaxID=104663 RepID=A0A1G8B988_CHIFI|nr:non-ribosomal peptide synthetase [Chitinophaga filiformis]SDH29160.1 amino acid adenylation domain-containing protein [Chitinophaga filiformis]